MLAYLGAEARRCSSTPTASRPDIICGLSLDARRTPGLDSVRAAERCQLHAVGSSTTAICTFILQVRSDVNHPSFTGNLYAPRLLRAFFDSTWLPIKAYGLQVVSVRWDDLANTTRPMAYVVGLRLIVPHAASLLTLELCDALESPPPSVDPLRLLEAPDFQPLHLPKLQALTISGCILSYVRLLGALRPPPNVCVSVSVDSRRLVDSRRVNHEIVPVSTALAAVLQRLRT